MFSRWCRHNAIDVNGHNPVAFAESNIFFAGVGRFIRGMQPYPNAPVLLDDFNSVIPPNDYGRSDHASLPKYANSTGVAQATVVSSDLLLKFSSILKSSPDDLPVNGTGKYSLLLLGVGVRWLLFNFATREHWLQQWV